MPSVLEKGPQRSESFENLDGDHDATGGFRCLKVRYCTLHLPLQLFRVSAFSLGTWKKVGEADTWDNPSSKVIECQQHGKPCAKGRQTLPDSWLLKVEDSRRFSKLKKAPRRNTFPSFTQFQCVKPTSHVFEVGTNFTLSTNSQEFDLQAGIRGKWHLKSGLRGKTFHWNAFSLMRKYFMMTSRAEHIGNLSKWQQL